MNAAANKWLSMYLRDAFDKAPSQLAQSHLIEVAKECGLYDLAEEMENDLQYSEKPKF